MKKDIWEPATPYEMAFARIRVCLDECLPGKEKLALLGVIKIAQQYLTEVIFEEIYPERKKKREKPKIVKYDIPKKVKNVGNTE